MKIYFNVGSTHFQAVYLVGLGSSELSNTVMESLSTALGLTKRECILRIVTQYATRQSPKETGCLKYNHEKIAFVKRHKLKHGHEAR